MALINDFLHRHREAGHQKPPILSPPHHTPFLKSALANITLSYAWFPPTEVSDMVICTSCASVVLTIKESRTQTQKNKNKKKDTRHIPGHWEGDRLDKAEGEEVHS